MANSALRQSTRPVCLPDTLRLTFLALLTALAILLGRAFVLRIPGGGADLIRIGFGALPVILAGLYFGPAAGGIVGAAADILGYLLNPVGIYMPHFTLTSALNGIIPGLFLAGRVPPFRARELILALALTRLVTHGFLVPYFLHVLFGIPLVASLLSHLVTQFFTVPAYLSVILPLQRGFLIIARKHSAGSGQPQG